MGVRGQRHAPAALHPGKDPVPIVQKAGWDAGPVWTGAENLAPTGIRSQDRPARSQSVYRLRYLAHNTTCIAGECMYGVLVRTTRGHSPVQVPLCLPEIPQVAKNYQLCALGPRRKGT